MTSHPAATSSRIARVVREALDAVASPSIRDEVLRKALFVAGLPEVPDSGGNLRDFVEIYLRQSIADSLSGLDAESVVQSLAPILRLAQQSDDDVSDVHPIGSVAAAVFQHPSDLPTDVPEPAGPSLLHPRVPPVSGVPVDLLGWTADAPPGSDRPTSPPTLPAPVLLPALVVASASARTANAVRRALGGRVMVRHAHDAIALLDALQSPDDDVRLVIVDGQHPAIRPSTFASMASDVPEQTCVILWGVDPLPALSELVDIRRGWQVHPTGTDVDDVAGSCIELMSL